MSGTRLSRATQSQWRHYGLHDGRPRYLYDRDLLSCFHFRLGTGVLAQAPAGETVLLHAGPFRERHAAADLIARLAGFLRW
nr:hypothetical protein [uncultured Lichenicoccus sp.]